MRTKFFPLDDSEERGPVSPLMNHALDVVEAMCRAGLVTVPREPSDGMVLAGMDAAGVKEPQARAIFRAMVAAADDDGVPLASIAH
jgi:hypothetical protein